MHPEIIGAIGTLLIITAPLVFTEAWEGARRHRSRDNHLPRKTRTPASTTPTGEWYRVKPRHRHQPPSYPTRRDAPGRAL